MKFEDESCGGIWKSPNEISHDGGGGLKKLSRIDNVGWNGGDGGSV